jgi:hypothetical protein
LYAALGSILHQRLRISVRHHELHAIKPAFNHVIDSIPPGAADSENRDTRLQLREIGYSKLDCHEAFPVKNRSPSISFRNTNKWLTNANQTCPDAIKFESERGRPLMNQSPLISSNQTPAQFRNLIRTLDDISGFLPVNYVHSRQSLSTNDKTTPSL